MPKLISIPTASLFVFQWLFDEAQMTADNVGAPVTKQQWDYIHQMGDSLRASFHNVTWVETLTLLHDTAQANINHWLIPKHTNAYPQQVNANHTPISYFLWAQTQY